MLLFASEFEQDLPSATRYSDIFLFVTAPACMWPTVAMTYHTHAYYVLNLQYAVGNFIVHPLRK
jgi:hypothetical protein